MVLPALCCAWLWLQASKAACGSPEQESSADSKHEMMSLHRFKPVIVPQGEYLQSRWDATTQAKDKMAFIKSQT